MYPLIDHGQQPMKMHTEVTLLYKYIYIYMHTDHAVCLEYIIFTLWLEWATHEKVAKKNHESKWSFPGIKLI